MSQVQGTALNMREKYAGTALNMREKYAGTALNMREKYAGKIREKDYCCMYVRMYICNVCVYVSMYVYM